MVFPFFRLVAKEELGIAAADDSISIAQAAEVTARATVMRSTSQIVELAVQTIMLPTLGPLSDSLGRRTVVILCIIAFACGAIILAGSVAALSPGLYVCGAAVQATGSALTTLTTVQVTDVVGDVTGRANVICVATVLGAGGGAVAAAAVTVSVLLDPSPARYEAAYAALAACCLAGLLLAWALWSETARLEGCPARLPCAGPPLSPCHWTPPQTAPPQTASASEALVSGGTAARGFRRAPEPPLLTELGAAAPEPDAEHSPPEAEGAAVGSESGVEGPSVELEMVSVAEEAAPGAEAAGGGPVARSRAVAPAPPAAPARAVAPVASAQLSLLELTPCCTVYGICCGPGPVCAALGPVLLALVGATALLTLQPLVTLAYQWPDSTVTGLLLGLLVAAAVSSALSGAVIGCLGPMRTIRAGAAAASLGFAVLSAAPAHPAVGVAGGLVLAASAFALPAVVAVLTKLVDPDRQGRLQTAVSSLGGLAAVAGTVVTSGIFVVAALRGIGVGPLVSGADESGVLVFVAPAMVVATLCVAGAWMWCEACVASRLDFKQRLAADERAAGPGRSLRRAAVTGGHVAPPAPEVDVALSPASI